MITKNLEQITSEDRLFKSIYDGKKLLLERNNKIDKDMIAALRRRGILKIDIREPGENLPDEDENRHGILDTKEKVLETRFKEFYEPEIKRKMRNEIKEDAKEGGKKIKKATGYIIENFHKALTDKQIEKINEKLFSAASEIGTKRYTDYEEDAFIKALGRYLQKGLTDKENLFFPEPFLNVEALKQIQGDYTYPHSLNVMKLSGLVGLYANFLGKMDALSFSYDITDVCICAGLHDVGKFKKEIHEILYLKRPFNKEEIEIKNQHPIWGAEILKEHKSQYGMKAILTAWQHHETGIGTGYPLGKVSNEVDPIAALVNVVDKYEAMTSKRCYRDRDITSEEACYNIINENFGSIDNFKKKIEMYGKNFTENLSKKDPFYIAAYCLCDLVGFFEDTKINKQVSLIGKYID